MEGKAVLFKKFANIDCFDIEVNEPDPVKLADIVCALEETMETVAHAVKIAIGRGVDLAQLPLAELQALDASITADVAEVLTLRGSLNARNLAGGTAPAQVRSQIERHRARLAT